MTATDSACRGQAGDGQDGLQGWLEAVPGAPQGGVCAQGESQCSDEQQQFACAVSGQLRWSEPELAAIASDQGQAQSLRVAYQRSPDNFSQWLGGHFALAIADGSRQRLLLCSDRIASIPLYYARVDNRWAFASSPRAIDALARPQPQAPDKQALYDYVYFHMIPAPRTIYTQAKKLQAASLVVLEMTAASSDAVEPQRYWQPQFRESAATDKRGAQQRLKQELKASVAAALDDDRRCGAFLSGGLDSSTVAGMLSEIQGGSAEAYAIGFDAPGYDEMAYARITAQHFGIQLNEYYVTPEDIVTALPDIISGYDEPFGNSSALPAYFCARMAAQNGTHTLLAGDGGDELFAGNERYAKQKAFHPYQRCPAFIRGPLLESALKLLPSGNALVRKANSYIDQAKTPLPARLQTYNFLHQNTPESVFPAAFLEHVSTDAPLALLDSIYQVPDNASELNRMLYLDWQITLADNDLRKVSQACALAGVQVRYPMLDDRLLSLSAELPSNWKLPGQQLRKFYKDALTGWLPDATINKSKHGFGLPFGVWMKEHAPLRDLAYDSIMALRDRNILRAEFLEQAVRQHREGHAAYYGELVWILMVLEIWLQQNQDRIAAL